jgi:hypothetical protein
MLKLKYAVSFKSSAQYQLDHADTNEHLPVIKSQTPK